VPSDNEPRLNPDIEQKLRREAERGYTPDQLRPRPGPGRPPLSGGSGPSPTVTVRLDEDLNNRLDEHTATSGRRRSDIVREALRDYLARSI